MNEYIIVDRTTATKEAIKVEDQRLLHESATGDARDEPVIRDSDDSSKYWKIYLDDGRLGTEETLVVKNDTVLLYDSTSGKTFRIIVSSGRWSISEASPSGRKVISVKHNTHPLYSRSGVYGVSRHLVSTVLSSSSIRSITSRHNQKKNIVSSKPFPMLDTSRFRYNQSPVESPDGVTTDFTLPNSDNFVSGLVEVFVNGNQKVKGSEWQENGITGISFIGSLATNPPRSSEDIRLNYITP